MTEAGGGHFLASRADRERVAIGTAVDKRMKSRRPGGQLPPRPGPRGGPPSGGTTGHDPVRPAARRDAIPGTGAIAAPALA